jgi:hypothetical protein
MPKFVPLHVKTMCFVYMLMKQVFDNIGVSAYASTLQMHLNFSWIHATSSIVFLGQKNSTH